MKTMTASSASKNFGNYIDTVRREPVMVTRQNRPVAVTFSIEDAEALISGQIETGVSKGLADVKAGRTHELSSDYTENMIARFSSRLKA